MKFKALFLVLFLTCGAAHAQQATFTVTKLADTNDGVCDADCSLREAIAAAGANGNTISDNIYFAYPLFGTLQTITLDPNLGPLVLDSSVFLVGPFTVGVNISGGDATRVFDIPTGGGGLFQSINVINGSGGKSAPGGLSITGGQVSLLYCIISDNRGGDGFFGHNGGAGGLSIFSGIVNLSSSIVNNNQGGKGGGGGRGGDGGIYVSSNAACHIHSSTIALNRGGNGGAGTSSPNLGSPNGGDGGAGGLVSYLNTTINHSTIALNTGGTGGTNGTSSGTFGKNGAGGVSQKGSYFTLSHTLFAFNASISTNVGGDIDGKVITDNGYNLVSQTFGTTEENGLTGTGDILNVNPVVDNDIKDNGGFTKTLALRTGSPALNAGDPSITGQNSYDQRGGGFPRVSGGRIDIGAFESQEVSLSISHGTMLIEGDSGTKSISFTVTLSGPSNQSVTVNYATQNATAVAPADYTATSGTLTFAAGETSKIISVTTKGDTLDEADEFFRVNLSAPTNAILGEATGIGLIEDDDTAPQVSINNLSVTEGNSGTTNATFTLTLSSPSGQMVKVNAIPTNGTAKSPADFTSGGATINFNAGETTKTFTVPVKGDTLDEANEVLYVLLSSPVNCTIKPGAGRGIATIVDDDLPPTISIDDVRIGEGNGGQRTAAFRLKLSAPSGQVVRVTAATKGLTATAGSDYTEFAPTQIAFTTGSIFAYARVLINGDTLNEANETFNVNLSNPIAATIN